MLQIQCQRSISANFIIKKLDHLEYVVREQVLHIYLHSSTSRSLPYGF